MIYFKSYKILQLDFFLNENLDKNHETFKINVSVYFKYLLLQKIIGNNEFGKPVINRKHVSVTKLTY